MRSATPQLAQLRFMGVVVSPEVRGSGSSPSEVVAGDSASAADAFEPLPPFFFFFLLVAVGMALFGGRRST